MSSDSRVCADCIIDSYLADRVRRNGCQPSLCDYCDGPASTASLHSIARLCSDAIEKRFQLTSQEMSAVLYERVPRGESLSDLLGRILSSNTKVVNSVVELLEEEWYERDSGESIYGEDPWFEASSALGDSVSQEWDRLEASLRSENRFANRGLLTMLDEIFGRALANDDSCIKVAGPDDSLARLYRARTFESDHRLQEALMHPERTLGTPPPGVSAAGRMNAPGVSVFYGATDKITAVAEVRPPVGSRVLVGAFVFVRPVRLLDLEKLAAVAAPEASVFDTEAVRPIAIRQFLRVLAERMVMPVMPETAHQDYLATQAIADYLAAHTEMNVDGIIFPSVQTGGADRNIVLFNKASGVRYADSRRSSLSFASLIEYDGDQRIDWPELVTKAGFEDEEDPIWRFDLERKNEPLLRLDRESLTIETVTAVAFTSTTRSVRHRRDVASLRGT